MFDYRVYYQSYNDPIIDDYEKTIEVIKDIQNKTNDYKTDLIKYFNFVSTFILDLYEHEKELSEEYFEQKSIDVLKQMNYKLYQDILPENYSSSYANPNYMVRCFGEEIGQMLSIVYVKIRDDIPYAYQHKLFRMKELNDLFISFYHAVMDSNSLDLEFLKDIIKNYAKKSMMHKYDNYFQNITDPKDTYVEDMLELEDFTHVNYLFKYGRYISDNEVTLAQYIQTLPNETIQLIANNYTESYRLGFIRDNKDMSKKSIVQMRYPIGLERIIKLSMKQFRALKLKPLVAQLYSVEPNRQYVLDHKYDHALYLDEAFADYEVKIAKAQIEKHKVNFKQSAGPAVIEIFGEKPFSPKTKKESLKYTQKQAELATRIQREIGIKINAYKPRNEWSFVMVSYPSPEIGDKFEEIFNETIKINTLDNNVFEPIQQTMIDALDLGDYVHIKGRDGNRTDIKVKLQTIKNPDKETNFHNCIADVNVPLGEVYTSPQLKGTHGILHLKQTFLQSASENFGLRYENLELKFKDGYVETYSCTNFDTVEEGKQFIKENLLKHYDRLPMGEFAIGTNTTAYVMADKYDIISILPILIIEKMGPHFAIGDTCFQFSEDLPLYNPLDGKEVTARDNEKSILRKTDMDQAYTFTHTDMTLPYCDIAFITVHTKSGKTIDIIRDGRFVLQGTEKLNEAFK